MLELLFLVRFSRFLAKTAKAKGRSGGWGGLGVGLWIGGELFGMIVGLAADMEAAAYVVALLCAAVGATISYFVVKSLKPLNQPELYPMMSPTAPGPVYVPPGAPDLVNPYAPPRTP